MRLKPGFTISKVFRQGWGESDAESVREGMRKAGLPE
jgi:hypothetical protein